MWEGPSPQMQGDLWGGRGSSKGGVEQGGVGRLSREDSQAEPWRERRNAPHWWRCVHKGTQTQWWETQTLWQTEVFLFQVYLAKINEWGWGRWTNPKKYPLRVEQKCINGLNLESYFKIGEERIQLGILKGANVKQIVWDITLERWMR